MSIAELFYARQAARVRHIPWKPRRRAPRRSVIFEALEPRVMLSADTGILAAVLADPAVVVQPAVPVSPDATSTDTVDVAALPPDGASRHTIVVVDPTIRDADRLVRGLDADVVVLDPQMDGVAQITGAL